ncbi:uncharacterized protein LOC112086121 [Eutrema salsugineum]|uniref:uncharacterized protein LOC112086121 n=1 Tax=Eutrema salsugineum TaxID=72664 RepID=UPI000CED0A13|nr:uncharacterized protein LOC112086121 [Eutrema salsugineum]
MPPYDASLGLERGSLALWLCWNIWTARNNLCFSDKSFSVSDTIAKAISNAKEWLEGQKSKLMSPQPLVYYAPEEFPSEFVCHTDAAWNPDNKWAGLGWTFSHHNKSEVHSFSRTHASVNSPLVAGGLALRAALLQAMSDNIRTI